VLYLIKPWLSHLKLSASFSAGTAIPCGVICPLAEIGIQQNGFVTGDFLKVFQLIGVIMEKYLASKIKMYGTSSKYLHNNQDKVDSIPRFKTALDEFDTNLALITGQEVHRNTTSEGKTEVKHDLEDEMILATVNVASTLLAYASEKKLPELKAISKISVRKFTRIKEIDLITKCTQIYNEAKKIENELADHGLLPSDIASLKSKIDEFRNAGTTRDSSVADRKGTGINIVDLIERQDELLEEQLDSFVNKFIAKDKLFYDGYYASRQIKEYGIRHIKKDDKDAGDAGSSSAPTQPGA
jgi:hypothetical protein